MPSFKSVGGLHLYYDEEDDGTWNLNDEPDGAGDAMPATGTGPVPLGVCTWQAWDGEAFATTAKLTTREVRKATTDITTFALYLGKALTKLKARKPN